MSDLIRRLGYDPNDLTMPEKLAEQVVRLRRLVLAVALAGGIGMGVTAWLVWQPARFALEVNGSTGWRLDTHTGHIEGLQWTSGVIKP